MGQSQAKEVMTYPAGTLCSELLDNEQKKTNTGIPCAASVTKFQYTTSMEEFTKKMSEHTQANRLPDGTLSPAVAAQFPHSDAKGINDANIIVCYESKEKCEAALQQAKAAWATLKDDLYGEPERMVIEGVVYPIAKFLFDEPNTLIPVGMSFGTYPLKPHVTLEIFTACLTEEAMAMFRNEFGLLWLWAGLGKVADGRPMAIISAVYSCEAACAVVSPKIGNVLKKAGMMELMDGSPFLRVVGPGFMIKK
jgi:hypothetical protein